MKQSDEFNGDCSVQLVNADDSSSLLKTARVIGEERDGLRVLIYMVCSADAVALMSASSAPDDCAVALSGWVSKGGTVVVLDVDDSSAVTTTRQSAKANNNVDAIRGISISCSVRCTTLYESSADEHSRLRRRFGIWDNSQPNKSDMQQDSPLHAGYRHQRDRIQRMISMISYHTRRSLTVGQCKHQ